jgi:hypothetical protein
VREKRQRERDRERENFHHRHVQEEREGESTKQEKTKQRTRLKGRFDPQLCGRFRAPTSKPRRPRRLNRWATKSYASSRESCASAFVVVKSEAKEPCLRGRRRRRIFLYLEKLLKNTTPPHTKREEKKQTSSSSFYLPSQNLTLALFALAVFTHALLRRRFDRDHDFFFKSFDFDDVIFFFFFFSFFFFHQHSSKYNSRSKQLYQYYY